MIEYYINSADESLSKTEVEMDYISVAPDKSAPWMLWAFVKLSECEDGLFVAENEVEKLEAFVSELTTKLSQEIEAGLVGKKYEDGWLELYYYAPTAKRFQNIVSAVTQSQFMVDSGSSKDAKWEHYLYNLYPNELMLQQIQSRYIIEELQEAGDDLSQEREVEHYLAFFTESNANRAIAILEGHGFTHKGISYDPQDDHGYTLVMSKVHTIDATILEDIAFELITTAQEEHGHYSGWGTGLSE